jgi:hypothetical protein
MRECGNLIENFFTKDDSRISRHLREGIFRYGKISCPYKKQIKKLSFIGQLLHFVYMKFKNR